MTAVRLGLRANAEQFSLLVVVNAFVGAMVGAIVISMYLPMFKMLTLIK